MTGTPIPPEGAERASIVAWLRERSAAVRQHHADVCMTEDDDILAEIITRMETFAFAAEQIEQGMHCEGPVDRPLSRDAALRTLNVRNNLVPKGYDGPTRLEPLVSSGGPYAGQ